jgi:hypothetical protein
VARAVAIVATLATSSTADLMYDTVAAGRQNHTQPVSIAPWKSRSCTSVCHRAHHRHTPPITEHTCSKPIIAYSIQRLTPDDDVRQRITAGTRATLPRTEIVDTSTRLYRSFSQHTNAIGMTSGVNSLCGGEAQARTISLVHGSKVARHSHTLSPHREVRVRPSR